MDGNTQDDQYKEVDDIIYYKNQIFLVPESKLKLKNLEGSARLTHSKTPRFPQNLWKGLKGDVLQYVRECVVCQ